MEPPISLVDCDLHWWKNALILNKSVNYIILTTCTWTKMLLHCLVDGNQLRFPLALVIIISDLSQIFSHMSILSEVCQFPILSFLTGFQWLLLHYVSWINIKHFTDFHYLLKDSSIMINTSLVNLVDEEVIFLIITRVHLEWIMRRWLPVLGCNKSHFYC